MDKHGAKTTVSESIQPRPLITQNFPGLDHCKLLDLKFRMYNLSRSLNHRKCQLSTSICMPTPYRSHQWDVVMFLEAVAANALSKEVNIMLLEQGSYMPGFFYGCSHYCLDLTRVHLLSAFDLLSNEFFSFPSISYTCHNCTICCALSLQETFRPEGPFSDMYAPVQLHEYS